MVIKDNNLVSLMKAVGEEGCVFCPSTFKDGIKSRETFEQSQLFVLTFGNANNEGLSFIKIKSRARAIQFYMIESELEQAVGRARLLRCDCTVNLFSDFPLKQAELKESKYDTDENDEDSEST